jgi:hypothetical protein
MILSFVRELTMENFDKPERKNKREMEAIQNAKAGEAVYDEDGKLFYHACFKHLARKK